MSNAVRKKTGRLVPTQISTSSTEFFGVCAQRSRQMTSKTLSTDSCCLLRIPAWCDHSTMISFPGHFELGGRSLARPPTASKQLTVSAPIPLPSPQLTNATLGASPTAITTPANNPPVASTNALVPPTATLTASGARRDHNHPANSPTTTCPAAPPDATPTGVPTGGKRKRPRGEASRPAEYNFVTMSTTTALAAPVALQAPVMLVHPLVPCAAASQADQSRIDPYPTSHPSSPGSRLLHPSYCIPQVSHGTSDLVFSQGRFASIQLSRMS